MGSRKRSPRRAVNNPEMKIVFFAMRIQSVTALFITLVCRSACIGQGHDFTVRDSIEMSTFTVPSGRERSGGPVVSPDANYFFVITTRGIIRSNKVESTIWLFSTEAVRRYLAEKNNGVDPPQPKALARIAAVPVGWASNAYEPVISTPRWALDSRSLYFLAQNSTAQHRLCSVALEGSGLKILSAPNEDVAIYDFSKDTLIYAANQSDWTHMNGGRSASGPIMENAKVVTGRPLVDILFARGYSAPQHYALHSIRNGRIREVPDSASYISRPDWENGWGVLSVSPDGREAVELRPVVGVPASWDSYISLGFAPGPFHHEDPLVTLPTSITRLRQYELVDLATGKSRSLTRAPYGITFYYPEPTRATWASSGRRVLLTNTFMALDGVNAAERAKRVHSCAVAAADVPSRAVQCIVFSRDASASTAEHPMPLRLESANFGRNEDEVVVHLGWPLEKRTQTEWYQYRDGNWLLTKQTLSVVGTSITESMPEASGKGDFLSVTIKQSLDDPPVLWATDRINLTGREIWNPNPQFAGMKFGDASIFHWKDETGHEYAGGLVKPVGYTPGRRYPLVIQTHGFQDFEFITDGAYPTAMAARPLASAGMVVLQVPENYSHPLTALEPHVNVLGYKAAIDRLVADGLVDPKRVGIIGFSRTCWYVETALIEAPSYFAAASISDGVDQSYMQQMIWGLGRISESEKIYGAAPFGAGLKRWLTLAPAFQLDKVRTPLLITAITPPSVLYEWETYSSLYQQNKPVEFLYLPGGEHILQKPLDRLASQQGNVDWFSFWLRGYERSNPEDPTQYSRWHRLRDMQMQPDQTATP